MMGHPDEFRRDVFPKPLLSSRRRRDLVRSDGYYGVRWRQSLAFDDEIPPASR
jgi:hypothetical protein